MEADEEVTGAAQVKDEGGWGLGSGSERVRKGWVLDIPESRTNRTC